jgi:hypothetical protein
VRWRSTWHANLFDSRKHSKRSLVIPRQLFGLLRHWPRLHYPRAILLILSALRRVPLMLSRIVSRGADQHGGNGQLHDDLLPGGCSYSLSIGCAEGEELSLAGFLQRRLWVTRVTFGPFARCLLLPSQRRNSRHPPTAAWGHFRTHASQQGTGPFRAICENRLL